MNRILLAAAAVGALGVAAPALAQYPDRDTAYGNVDVRIGRLQARLDAGVRQGTISPREAGPLRLQLRELMRLDRFYGRDGLSRQERADLDLRIRNLRERIRVADGGGYDRYDRDDRYRGDVRYDRNRDGDDDRYDRDDDGDDDRYDRNDDDRDDRYDRNADGRDDRYDRDADGVDDRYDRDDGVALRVGQRAPADLGAVPYEYRGQYRDGDGAYYRSDGRAIYQIDTRTQTVVRIYPLNR